MGWRVLGSRYRRSTSTWHSYTHRTNQNCLGWFRTRSDISADDYRPKLCFWLSKEVVLTDINKPISEYRLYSILLASYICNRVNILVLDVTCVLTPANQWSLNRCKQVLESSANGDVLDTFDGMRRIRIRWNTVDMEHVLSANRSVYLL